MHVLQFIAVEAANGEAAEAKLEAFIEDCFRDPNPSTWFDWHSIGGRWEGFFDGRNHISLADADKFEELIKDIRHSRQENFESLRGRFNFDGAEELFSTHDVEETDFNKSEQLWRLERMIKIIDNSWNSGSIFYDTVEYTASLKHVIKRVAEKPETQFVVAVDFHH
jgi:hypothetical protein